MRKQKRSKRDAIDQFFVFTSLDQFERVKTCASLRFRSEKSFSQEVFASKIGVHVTNLSKYERSKSVPSLEIAEKMATALDMSLDQMVYGQQNEKARTHIVDNQLLNLFNKTQHLSDDQKKTVMDLLSAFLLKANLKQELTY